MNILSFESTCDETAVAVVQDGRKILTDQIFSQAKLHAVYGGVVPEIASRSHVEAISLLTERALEEAGLSYGTDGQITLISFDAAQHALQLCLEGKINACMECNPLHGPRVAALIRQMEEGKTPGKLNYVLESVYDADDLTPAFLAAREY